MANVGDILTTVESGLRRIDDRFYAFKFINCVQDTMSNDFNGTRTSFTSKDSKIEFYVYTSKLYIYADDCTGYRVDNFQVEIDGVMENVTYTHKNLSDNRSVLQYKNINLEKKIHHVIISAKDAKENMAMTLDCIDIDEDGYMVYCDDNNKLYYDVTPIMTSNTTPEGYEASASTNFGGNYSPYKVFDGINNKESTGWASASNNNQNQYITLKNKNITMVSNLLLTTTKNGDLEAPKRFNIEGSKDNNKWITLSSYTVTDWNRDNGGFNTKIFNCFGKYKYYRLFMYETNGPSTILFSLGELRYLLAVDTPFYLIDDNGVYKNYNEESNSLVEVQDTSILNADTINNTCIYDLNKVKDLIDLKSNGVKVISNKNIKAKTKVLKTTKQMIIGSGDFSTRLADNIDYFKFQYNISDENCVIKTVISIDSGKTWKSYINGNWESLENSVTIKDYSDLTELEKNNWNNLLDEILTKGINIKDINETLDFNSLDMEKCRFAYVIQIRDINSKALLKDLKMQFDSIGSYEQLNPKTEVNIKMTNKDISITPLKNIELMKINVGISSQVPQQVLDTSGLMDKKTFKGKDEDSVKKADSIYVPDDVILNSDYGIDINGNLGYHPRIPIPNEITSYIFPMLTKDIQQSLSIESEGINYMVQCYAKQPDLTNVEEVFESYANPIVTNHSDNVETVEDNGTKITQIKNTNIYKSVLDEETGFYISELDISEYIDIKSIEEVGE